MPFLLRQLMLRQGYMQEAIDGTLDTGSAGTTPPETAPPADAPADAPAEESVEELKSRLSALEQEKAELLKDTMKKKGKVKELSETLGRFGDVTPERLSELLEAEKTRIDAETDAERQRLESKGQWDKLKQQMVDQHTTELDSLRGTLTTEQTEKQALLNQILELTVGQSFSQSRYLTEETVLPPSKARAFYGSHFDVVDGKVVGFDKPQGASDRTMLVDAKGEAVEFETAISRIVSSDPDCAYITRSRQKTGAQSTSDVGRGATSAPKTIDEKLSAGLAKLMG